MSITGPGSITAANVAAQTNMMNQLNTLGQELASGQATQTYSGLQSQAGVALALNAQLSAIAGYSNTATTVGTTLSVAQSVLTQLGTASSSIVQAIGEQGTFQLNNNGQTITQGTAAAQLDNILSLLNTQVGSNYIFSGAGPNQQSVASASDILNGNGAQAGLTQVISERQQADLGASGLGHLSVAVGGAGSSTVTLSQDGTPFGFQLTGVNSSLTGATVTGPSAPPASILVDLGSNPNPGELDPVSAHASRRLDPNYFATGDNEFAAGCEPVHHRYVALRYRDQSADDLDDRHYRSDADRVAGRLCYGSGQRLLQRSPAPG